MSQEKAFEMIKSLLAEMYADGWDDGADSIENNEYVYQLDMLVDIAMKKVYNVFKEGDTT